MISEANYTEGVAYTLVDCTNPLTREQGLGLAAEAVARGDIIVMPTDTVYGVACDAFSPQAVNALLATKGRGRHMPPPVLVGSPDVVVTLVETVPSEARAVMEAFWPGGVTIIFRQHSDVSWDLGDTQGTVAIRMPNNDVALELLNRTGPLAVSSANKTGQLPAHDVDDALAQLGDLVSVYLDGGPVGMAGEGASSNPGSTIIDASRLDQGGGWKVVRNGVLPIETLRLVAGGVWES
jgi:tRNA threonylcarbamoyl adenosine modification protein (Sua5/YciO/YrdC/YwlC family)